MNEMQKPPAIARDDAREEPHEHLPSAPAAEPTSPPARAKGLSGARILGLAVLLHSMRGIGDRLLAALQAARASDDNGRAAP